MPYFAPNLLTRGIESDGILDLRPAAGFHAQITGLGQIASLWLNTRTTGAATSDYAHQRYTRAGAYRWRTGFNIDGSGNDNWTIERDADGAVAAATAMKITRTNLRVDFYGDVYINGAQVSPAGATLAFPYTHTGSNAAEAFAIYNSHASGYGLKVRSVGSTIAADRYALSVKYADDSKRSFTVYSEDAIAQIGPTPPAIQWYTAGVAPNVASGGTNTYTRANRLLITSTADDSGFVMVSNVTLNPASYTAGPNQQANIGLVGANSTGKIRMNMITASSDGGWRYYANIRQDWTQADTNRWTLKWGTDSGCRFFGIGGLQPGDSSYNPVTAWSDDGVERDFELFIWPGGANTTNWGRGKYVEIGTVRVNKGIDFVTQASASYDYAGLKTALRIEPGSGGTEGTVEAKGYFWSSAPAGARVDGTLYLTGGSSSKAPLEIPAGAPASPSNNHVWFVGDVMYRRISGVTKSLTFT